MGAAGGVHVPFSAPFLHLAAHYDTIRRLIALSAARARRPHHHRHRHCHLYRHHRPRSARPRCAAFSPDRALAQRAAADGDTNDDSKKHRRAAPHCRGARGHGRATYGARAVATRWKTACRRRRASARAHCRRHRADIIIIIIEGERERERGWWRG
eukprot:IDg17079t1